MTKAFGLKLFAIAGVVGLLTAGGGSHALAATVSGSQDSQVTVSVTTDKESATYGETVSVTRTVTSNVRKTQHVTVSYNLEGPGQSHTYSESLTLSGSETVTTTSDFVIDRSYAPGTYTLTWTASTGKGASTCSTTFTITE